MKVLLDTLAMHCFGVMTETGATRTAALIR
jgi:hypothetical protein